MIFFIQFINNTNENNHTQKDVNVSKKIKNQPFRHKTKRNISERMRFRILMRDGFSCKSCGKSPVKELGVELHVDHILPWSKG